MEEKLEKYEKISVYRKQKLKNEVTKHKTPSLDILKTLTFNESTVWLDETLPNKILEQGKIPPLGIKEIHAKGITGKGVNVAIIDQPLALDHPEYKGKIAEYKVFAPEGYEMPISSLHGPAVTSMLIGSNTGTAPDAKVYYCAVPMWLGDAEYEVNALRYIMELNKSLPVNQKIKFVSVSAAPGSKEARQKNSEKWLETVKAAEETGLCVVDCTEGHRFITAGFMDFESKEFKYGFPNMEMNINQQDEVHVPCSLRTIAESFDNKEFSYSYTGVGGLSWGIPYAVGVFCLALQANPNLSAKELKALMIKTAARNNGIINPVEFIDMAKSKKENNLKEKE